MSNNIHNIILNYSDPGYIYILSHPSYKDCIKISRSNLPNKRLTTHSCSHLISPKMSYIQFCQNYKLAERLIHQKLYKNRIKSNSGGKEFFNIDINYAITIINQIINSVNNPIIVDTLNDILIMS
jgi:hypothetical protein